MSSTILFAKDCPKNFSILKKGNFENHFPNFVNFAYRFKGRCRGHSLVVQKTFYLFEFDKGENPYQCNKEHFPFECQSFYYDKFIEMFFDKKVVEIPGFKNLEEFSKIPYIEGLLKYHVSHTPVTFNSLEAKNRFQNETNPSVAHFKEAVDRVSEFQRPYISISSFWTGEHAVLAYRHTTINGQFRLCVRDPNLIPNKSIECENYFYLDKYTVKVPAVNLNEEPTSKTTEEVFYHKRGEEIERHLFKVRLYIEEDARVKEYIQARVDYCQSKT